MSGFVASWCWCGGGGSGVLFQGDVRARRVTTVNRDSSLLRLDRQQQAGGDAAGMPVQRHGMERSARHAATLPLPLRGGMSAPADPGATKPRPSCPSWRTWRPPLAGHLCCRQQQDGWFCCAPVEGARYPERSHSLSVLLLYSRVKSTTMNVADLMVRADHAVSACFGRGEVAPRPSSIAASAPR